MAAAKKFEADKDRLMAIQLLRPGHDEPVERDLDTEKTVQEQKVEYVGAPQAVDLVMVLNFSGERRKVLQDGKRLSEYEDDLSECDTVQLILEKEVAALGGGSDLSSIGCNARN